MKLNQTEYQHMLQKESPNSPLGRDMLWAGVIGGLICVVGEAVSTFYKGRGMDTEGAAGATAITMVFLGALLTGLHLYDKQAQAPLCPSPALPTRLCPRPWSLSRRALCSALEPSCLPLPGRCLCTASRPA